MSEEIKEQKETKVFTYQVTMIVSIFDTEEKSAHDKLDREGGYVSKRDVVLLDAQPIIK